jgi:AGCS family alanine or glycine:cation symporter
MKAFENIVILINDIVWGWPLICLILGCGFYFSLKTGILRFARLKLATKYSLQQDFGDGNVSVFAALCTALSATIGTGNIVGIAMAMMYGGPGALFWLWISSILSLAIKYAEGFLSIKYRVPGANGEICGGPMYYILIGMHSKPYAKVLSYAFAICGIMVALVGIGTLAQSNSIAVALESFGCSSTTSTIIISITTAIVILGGLRRIAAVSEKIVPIMTVSYIFFACVVLAINYAVIPDVFAAIFKGAFCPDAILGAGCGITVSQAVSIGVSRGIFSHESGIGSAAIAAASAKTNSPVRQGLVSMTGAMMSIIIGTMTGLVLIITCNETMIFSKNLQIEGTQLVAHAFNAGLHCVSFGEYVVNLGIIFFAFTTTIGWNYYGEKCVQFLFSEKYVIPYKLLFLFFVGLGPFYKIDVIFKLADIAIGLMAIPNLIGLISLRKIIISETKTFWSKQA